MEQSKSQSTGGGWLETDPALAVLPVLPFDPALTLLARLPWELPPPPLPTLPDCREDAEELRTEELLMSRQRLRQLQSTLVALEAAMLSLLLPPPVDSQAATQAAR